MDRISSAYQEEYRFVAAMISVNKAQVPAYLQKGEFFQTLSCDDDEEVEVPSDTIKPSSAVGSLSDLRLVLSSLRYWIVTEIPGPVVAFVMEQGTSITESVMLEFSENNARLKMLWSIRTASESERMEMAIKSGIFEIVEYLYQQEEFGNYCPIAAKYGQLDCLKYFHEQGSVWDHRTTKAAAIFGQLECLKYAMDNGCPTKGTLQKAKFPHNFLICTVALTTYKFQQYASNIPDPMYFTGLHEVSAESKLEVLKYLRSQGCPWNFTTLRAAVAGGHLETLKYLQENGCVVFNEACNIAAWFGHLDCIQYLHAHGHKWDRQTTNSAAMNGHLHCLQYLHEHGCLWYITICDIAAQHGHLNCLQYAHEQGAVLTVTTTNAAAGYGKLDCLMYLHEHGCPWDSDACKGAAEKGHLHCLQYLRANGCNWDGAVTDAAAQQGHLQCLQYAHENGCPWDGRATDLAAQNGHVECLRYLVEHGCPCDISSMAVRLVRLNANYAMSGIASPNLAATIVYLQEAAAKLEVV